MRCPHTRAGLCDMRGPVGAGASGAWMQANLLQPCTEKGNDKKNVSNLLRNNAQVSNVCQETCRSFVPSSHITNTAGHTQLNSRVNVN